MIENLSSWAKGIILAIIVVSILEMLLPNNKTKKYIKMVMGVFILFNIISPFINANNLGDVENVDIENYTNISNSLVKNQTSMDDRLEQLYIEEIEKDITKKVEKKGYKVNSCKVKAKITGNEEEVGITKITLKVEKNKEVQEQETEENLENKIVTEVQKIKKVNTKISEDEEQENTQLEKSDIQNLKQFLIEEYEVNEKCLEIN